MVNYVLFFGLPRTLALQYVRTRLISLRGMLSVGALSLLGLASIVCLAPLLASRGTDVYYAVCVTAVSLPVLGFALIAQEIILAEAKTVEVNVVRAIPLTVPSLGIIVVGLLGQLDFWWAFGLTMGSALLANLISICFALKQLSAVATGTPVDWSFSGRYWLTVGIDNVSRRLDMLAGAIVLSPTALGIYAIASTCASASGALTQAINQVSYGRLMKESVTTTKRADRLRIIMAVLAGLMVSATVDLLGPIIFGPGFEGLGLATAILCIAQVFRDQWSWQVLRDSVSKEARGLAMSSILGLAALMVGILLVSFSEGSPDAWSLAAAAAFGALARLIPTFSQSSMARTLWRTDRGDRR
ncbi:lipopolysaccharide biosynthesis protein [Nocardioides bruguierae]|uniref:Uncharacterized protein n=1 Tax=Nocardioides bruguierae TaxID=2945102 RepID=A0A9X2D9M6_9ACTN|nr:hypothetical protein [Nocardioides bruguierae]MCM0621837.1 hypothetical protein [Nocardioides bruguierae]